MILTCPICETEWTVTLDESARENAEKVPCTCCQKKMPLEKLLAYISTNKTYIKNLQ